MKTDAEIESKKKETSKKAILVNTANIPSTSKQEMKVEEEKVEHLSDHDEDMDEPMPVNAFRSYKQPSNHHRKKREEHIAEFPWEIKVPRYIKDDFKNYLNQELFNQMYNFI